MSTFKILRIFFSRKKCLRSGLLRLVLQHSHIPSGVGMMVPKHLLTNDDHPPSLHITKERGRVPDSAEGKYGL